jgi:hypothetical protein
MTSQRPLNSKNAINKIYAKEKRIEANLKPKKKDIEPVKPKQEQSPAAEVEKILRDDPEIREIEVRAAQKASSELSELKKSNIIEYGKRWSPEI